jgi:hypothetical protein
MSSKKQDFFDDIEVVDLLRFRKEHFAVFASAHSIKTGSVLLGVVNGQFCVDAKGVRFSFEQDTRAAIYKFKELCNQKSE